jgi:hypothetical protein
VPRSEVNCQLTLIGAFKREKSVLVDDGIDLKDSTAIPPHSPSPSTASTHDVRDKIFKNDSDVLKSARSAETFFRIEFHTLTQSTGDAETFAKLPRALQQKERKNKKLRQKVTSQAS